MKKKGKQRIGIRIWILRALAFSFFAMFAIALGLGIYVSNHFVFRFPNEILQLSAKGESPRFFVYQFTDRANREGALEEVTETVFAQKTSVYVPYNEIPKPLIQAFVAIEDKRFFEHNGVDWYRTVAAGLNHILGSSNRFGASTVTQQLVKNLTGNDEVSAKRKMQEILYALDLERELDKTEIMELYLNVIHFSDQCDGIAQAAMHYFSKTPMKLTVSECASIAAITNSPSYYNPIRHPENNLMRRNLILSEMYNQGYLNRESYENAVSEPLSLCVQNENCSDGVNSWYVDMVIEDVLSDLMTEYGVNRATASKMLYSGGLRIEMAMDSEVQKIVETYYRTAVRTPVNANGVSAQSALIAIDSRTGDILGVAGSIGEKKGNRLQNFATQTLRPPGSALKPISVYAPALEEGLINWASVYDDVPTDFDIAGKTAWPRNATGVYRGLTNVSYAVAHSTNTVAVRILKELGLEKSYSFTKERFHLNTLVSQKGANDCDLAALALGQLNYGVTLRDLTTAYTVFADGGVYHPWHSYYRVTDSDGKILLSSADRGEIVISEGNAAIMTKLLQGVIQNGTSSSVTLGQTVECAGKTGTTNRDGDRWFVGYTPDVICGVWCGYEYPEPLAGRNMCIDIWNSVMRDIAEKKGGRTEFTVPSSVVRATYCKDSGELIGETCLHDPRGDRSEVGWFLKGSEPDTVCTRHVLCEYDAVCGGICHGNCPKENVESIAFIRIERDFPIQIYVSDAQYVYDENPQTLAPNEDATKAYFAKEKHGFCGISAVTKPYNRSCTEHLLPPQKESPWDYLISKFEVSEDE